MIRTAFLILFSVFFINGQAADTKDAKDADNQDSGPPKVLVDACKDKSEGTSCTFEDPDKNTLKGTCYKIPDGKNILICAATPPKEAIEACKSKKDGDDCSFADSKNNKINGTCLKLLGGEGERACAGTPPDDDNDSKDKD